MEVKDEREEEGEKKALPCAVLAKKGKEERV